MVGFGRHTLFGMAVLAATGVPYALSNLAGERAREGRSAESDPLAEAPRLPVASSDGAPNPVQLMAASVQPPVQPLEGPQVVDLAEVLRFDIAPAWLVQRWPRVMSTRHDGGLQAYRVLLVTGMKESDLAGPLTYYFNPSQQLERIRFQGATGDCRPLVQHLTSRFQMSRQSTADPAEQLYVVKRDGKVVSQLRVVTASFLDASMPTARYHVELSLARPSEHRWFSEAGPALGGIRWP